MILERAKFFEHPTGCLREVNPPLPAPFGGVAQLVERHWPHGFSRPANPMMLQVRLLPPPFYRPTGQEDQMNSDITILRASLQQAIQKWIDSVCESPEWESLGWFGEDLAAHMASSAVNLIEYGYNVNETMKSNEVLKD